MTLRRGDTSIGDALVGLGTFAAGICFVLLVLLAYLVVYALGLAIVVFIALHVLQFFGVNVPFVLLGGVLP